jgi:hypothetical protein
MGFDVPGSAGFDHGVENDDKASGDGDNGADVLYRRADEMTCRVISCADGDAQRRAGFTGSPTSQFVGEPVLRRDRLASGPQCRQGGVGLCRFPHPGGQARLIFAGIGPRTEAFGFTNHEPADQPRVQRIVFSALTAGFDEPAHTPAIHRNRRQARFAKDRDRQTFITAGRLQPNPDEALLFRAFGQRRDGLGRGRLPSLSTPFQGGRPGPTHPLKHSFLIQVGISGVHSGGARNPSP